MERSNGYFEGQASIIQFIVLPKLNILQEAQWFIAFVQPLDIWTRFFSINYLPTTALVIEKGGCPCFWGAKTLYLGSRYISFCVFSSETSIGHHDTWYITSWEVYIFYADTNGAMGRGGNMGQVALAGLLAVSKAAP